MECSETVRDDCPPVVGYHYNAGQSKGVEEGDKVQRDRVGGVRRYILWFGLSIQRLSVLRCKYAPDYSYAFPGTDAIRGDHSIPGSNPYRDLMSPAVPRVYVLLFFLFLCTVSIDAHQKSGKPWIKSNVRCVSG